MAEYVCADGRMSVNGVCSVINQNVGNSDVNNNITKNYSKDVKSNFQWDFDKVGDKVGNFNDILTNSLNSFDTYVAENVTLENIAKTTIQNKVLGKALGPYAIPVTIGKSIFDIFQTNKNIKNSINTNIKSDSNIEGGNNTIDMATYGIPTAGQTGFNIHNDAGDNNTNQSNNAGGGTFGDSVNNNNSFSDYS